MLKSNQPKYNSAINSNRRAWPGQGKEVTVRNIKTREGYDFWDKLCAIPRYGFIHSADNSRILKAEGVGNWIDMHAAQEVVDAAQDEINRLRAELTNATERLRAAEALAQSRVLQIPTTTEVLAVFADLTQEHRGEADEFAKVVQQRCGERTLVAFFQSGADLQALDEAAMLAAGWIRAGKCCDGGDQWGRAPGCHKLP